jgi:hypothetical protein
MLIENKTSLLLAMCRYCVSSKEFTPDIRIEPCGRGTFEGPPFTPHKIVCHDDATNWESGEFHVSPGNSIAYPNPKRTYYLVIRCHQDKLPRFRS